MNRQTENVKLVEVILEIFEKRQPEEPNDIIEFGVYCTMLGVEVGKLLSKDANREVN